MQTWLLFAAIRHALAILFAPLFRGGAVRILGEVLAGGLVPGGAGRLRHGGQAGLALTGGLVPFLAGGAIRVRRAVGASERVPLAASLTQTQRP